MAKLKASVKIDRLPSLKVKITRRLDAEPGRDPAGGLSAQLRRRAGDPLPYKISERRHVLTREIPRLKRIMRENRGSIFIEGYEVPLQRGIPVGRTGGLRRSAFVTVNQQAVMRFGYRRMYARTLNYGYILGQDKTFTIRDGREITLKAGHYVKPRFFLENNARRWFREMNQRLRAHRASGKPWSRYR